MIYTKLTISGVEYTDAVNINVNKAISDNNSTSYFNSWFYNTAGRHASDFKMNNEIIIRAGSDTTTSNNPVIFTGLLENVKFEGEGLKEKVTLDGRDYSARLMDVTVEPEVYNQLSAGSIVKDIVTKYANEINVGSVQNGETISKMVFNQLNCYDAVKQLSDLSDYMFYVDNDKYLHFEPIGTTNSNVNLGSINVMKANFQERRDTIYNAIWVYGDRYLGGCRQEFNPGSLTGSIAVLPYKPHNTLVEWNGQVLKGGVLNMNFGQESGVGYLVDFDNKYIVFTSGTTWGDYIPTTGSGIINYDRDLPIVKYTQDDNSIQSYGKRNKLIVNKDIKDPQMAQELMLSELDKNKDPKMQGKLDLKGVYNLTPGNTVGIFLPNYGLSGNSYDLLNCQYAFNILNNKTERVLSVTVNKKLKDVTDTIKDILLNLKKVQGADISDADIITRYHSTTGSFGIRQSGCIVWTRDVTGSVMIWGSDAFGIWGTNKWGVGSNAFTDWSINYSGNYPPPIGKGYKTVHIM